MDQVALTTLLGPHADRLRGIEGWADLAHLGRSNLGHIVDFASKAMLDEIAEMDREERAGRAAGLEQLRAFHQSSVGIKPVLPRLRVECFRPGQPVQLLLADTPGAADAWRSATVSEVAKRHKPEWAHHFPSRGYYWRVTAHAEQPMLGSRHDLAFSTSEPRVSSVRDLAYLVGADDPEFRRIYCENARRSWNPVWCDEAGVQASGEALDLGRWLGVAA